MYAGAFMSVRVFAAFCHFLLVAAASSDSPVSWLMLAFVSSLRIFASLAQGLPILFTYSGELAFTATVF